MRAEKSEMIRRKSLKNEQRKSQLFFTKKAYQLDQVRPLKTAGADRVSRNTMFQTDDSVNKISYDKSKFVFEFKQFDNTL